MSDGPPARPNADPPEVLRAKYHDYCSAQLADLLLYLSPDEIYLLAQRDVSDLPDAPGTLTYVRAVEVATEWISRRVSLPPFEVWLADYLRNPAPYEALFMRLWESDPEPSGDLPTGA